MTTEEARDAVLSAIRSGRPSAILDDTNWQSVYHLEEFAEEWADDHSQELMSWYQYFGHIAAAARQWNDARVPCGWCQVAVVVVSVETAARGLIEGTAIRVHNAYSIVRACIKYAESWGAL